MDHGLRVDLLLTLFQCVPHGVVDHAFLLEVALVTLVVVVGVVSKFSRVSLVREG